MNIQEIASYLSVSSASSVVVDCTVIESLGGMVRTTTIFPEVKVRMEFESWGHEEGGIYFTAEYDILPSLVAALETYFGSPIRNWKNISRTGYYPNQPKIEIISSEEVAILFKTNTSKITRGCTVSVAERKLLEQHIQRA